MLLITAPHGPESSGACTSVQRMTFPLALYSEPWKILTLVMDSMDLPSMGLMTLGGGHISRLTEVNDLWLVRMAMTKQFVTDTDGRTHRQR